MKLKDNREKHLDSFIGLLRRERKGIPLPQSEISDNITRPSRTYFLLPLKNGATPNKLGGTNDHRYVFYTVKNDIKLLQINMEGSFNQLRFKKKKPRFLSLTFYLRTYIQSHLKLDLKLPPAGRWPNK